MAAEPQDYRLAQVPCANGPFLLQTVWNMPVPVDPHNVSYQAVQITVIDPSTGCTYNGELSFARIAVSALFHNISWLQFYKVCKVLLGNGSRKHIRYTTASTELFNEFAIDIAIVGDVARLTWSGTDENGQHVTYDRYELKAGTLVQTKDYKQMLHKVAEQVGREFRTTLELRQGVQKLITEVRWLETQIALRTKKSDAVPVASKPQARKGKKR